MSINISFDDVALAYRKAKYEIFHDNNYTMVEKIVDYEKNLSQNLSRLHAMFTDNNRRFIYNHGFLGSNEWVLKKVEIFDNQKDRNQKNDFVYRTNRLDDWRHKNREYKIRYRYIGNLSIDFHILGSLWIDKVGHLLETAIGECSYGCRLKRPRQFNRFIPEFNFPEEIAPKRFDHGHFRFYPPDYKRWQKDGLMVMKEALANKKSIIALTTDIQSFYHRINPSFLLDSDFMESMEINYDYTQEYLTRLLVNAIAHWGKNIKDDYIDNEIGSPHGGIPVGWACSKIIANLLLHKFDNSVKNGLTPLYYGRYVDDIFIVLEDNGNLVTKDDVWKFIKMRVDGVNYTSNREDSSQQDYAAEFSHPFSPESIIKFGHDKEKVFVFEGTSGETLIEKVEQSLDENSSEWRLLPESEESMVKMADDIASSGSDFSEAVDSLRKSDGISIGRLKFILLIQKLETMVDCLPKQLWYKSLKKLFAFCKDFILVPENLPVYCLYHSRLISLFSRAKMYKEVMAMYETINECFSILANNDYHSDNLLNRSREFHNRVLREAFLRGFTESNNKNDSQLARVLEVFYLNREEALKKSGLIFSSDLHRIPFKEIFFAKATRTIFLGGLSDKPAQSEIFNRLEYPQIRALSEFWTSQKQLNSITELFPPALFFVTRPMTLLDLTVLYPKWSKSKKNFNKFERITAGFGLKLNINPPANLGDNLELLEINSGKRSKNPVIALTSFLVSYNSWKALVRQDGNDPDHTRIPRMFELANDVLRCKADIDYVVFPELSIPRRVLSLIAKRFNNAGISLITGGEYIFKAEGNGQFRGYVKNQLLYFLTTKNNQVIRVTQEKTIPAIHEEREIFQIGGWLLKADDQTKYIIDHNGFSFSGLICNDFLNIDNRQQLRGLIDTLIVIEWNQDTNTYDSLVQSSSNDLHCFVIQVNNREFGDTRLRGPYKEVYKRDRVSVRGGILDYFVVSDIEVDKLRDFQRHFRSPDGPFKPVPTGFKMSNRRRRLN